MSEENSKIEDLTRWVTAMKRNETELNKLSSPLALATKFAETVSHAKNADMAVLVPQIAEDWATEVIQEFAFLVGEIARVAEVSSKLRDMFDPEQLTSIEWNEGIMLNQILPYEGAHLEPEWVEDNTHYHEFGSEPSLLAHFRPDILKDRYLSGQYNRLFPLKIVMRVAANLLLNSEGYKMLNEEEGGLTYTPLFLEDLRIESAKVAAYAKKRMEWLDSANGTEYGNWFSVALTDGSKKQNERFMSQFVGSVRSPEEGLPFELGFLDLNDGEVASPNSDCNSQSWKIRLSIARISRTKALSQFKREG